MLLKIGASYLADLVHANHPHKPFPATQAKGKDADTNVRGVGIGRENPPQGVTIAREFATCGNSQNGKSVVARWGPEDFLETRALAVKWETKDDHSIVRTLKSALEAAIVAI